MTTSHSSAAETQTTPAPAPATAFVPVRYSDPPIPEGRFLLSKRRLKDIPRALQRPLECHLQSLRRAGDKSTTEISSRLDLHPELKLAIAFE